MIIYDYNISENTCQNLKIKQERIKNQLIIKR